MAKVTIIDYGMGNLQSVAMGFEALDCHVTVAKDASEIEAAERLVLPGVGAFGEGMNHLRERGLIDAMKEQVLVQKKPFLGICLGMQLLADRGYEFGDHEGLGWIPGEVVKMNTNGFLLPHVGWNNLKIKNNSPLLDEALNGTDFYFVHSFHFKAKNEEHVNTTTDYGEEFSSMVSKDNVFGTQFHPEKSQKAGKIILENFLKL